MNNPAANQGPTEAPQESLSEKGAANKEKMKMIDNAADRIQDILEDQGWNPEAVIEKMEEQQDPDIAAQYAEKSIEANQAEMDSASKRLAEIESVRVTNYPDGRQILEGTPEAIKALLDG
ncbi:hypothetical protein HOD24_01685 [Candidatus Peregrinibacteria bacterium]|jgi:hypothetical protein|nr:hypothetical protein [Candidatus Peregrinibacteria bacterium]